MTTISASLPVYTPPVSAVTITPPTPATPDPTANIPVTTSSLSSTNQPATNANDSAGGVYTALANVSAPIIRGTNINTAL